MMLGKLQRAHPTFHSHFAPAYLVGSNMLYLWAQRMCIEALLLESYDHHMEAFLCGMLIPGFY